MQASQHGIILKQVPIRYKQSNFINNKRSVLHGKGSKVQFCSPLLPSVLSISSGWTEHIYSLNCQETSGDKEPPTYKEATDEFVTVLSSEKVYASCYMHSLYVLAIVCIKLPYLYYLKLPYLYNLKMLGQEPGDLSLLYEFACKEMSKKSFL